MRVYSGYVNRNIASNIREIQRTSLLDIPNQLRALAERVEKENVKTCIVILGFENGNVAVVGYGKRSDPLSATGWLARAQAALTSDCMADDDAGPVAG